MTRASSRQNTGCSPRIPIILAPRIHYSRTSSVSTRPYHACFSLWHATTPARALIGTWRICRCKISPDITRSGWWMPPLLGNVLGTWCGGSYCLMPSPPPSWKWVACVTVTAARCRVTLSVSPWSSRCWCGAAKPKAAATTSPIFCR